MTCPETVMENFRNKHPEVTDTRVLPVESVLLTDWTREKCKSCEMYDSSWSCPPSLPGLDESRKTMSQYKKAVLVSFITKSLGEQKSFQPLLLGLERSFRKSGFKALALFTGPCSFCSKCSYPEPCKKPDLLRPTIEGFGVDVLGTLEREGIKNPKPKRGKAFVSYGMVLVG